MNSDVQSRASLSIAEEPACRVTKPLSMESSQDCHLVNTKHLKCFVYISLAQLLQLGTYQDIPAIELVQEEAQTFD